MLGVSLSLLPGLHPDSHVMNETRMRLMTRNNTKQLVRLIVTISLLTTPQWPLIAKPPSLAEQVTIRRDAFGVPHILAKTEEAAAFGFGYAQAEDHCEEIARGFVSARGEN